MTTQQISHRLQLILTNSGIRFTTLTDQTAFRSDLGLDSLDVTDLLIRVEDEFSIRIPDEHWWKLTTWGQLRGYVADELGDQTSVLVRPVTLQWPDVYSLPL